MATSDTNIRELRILHFNDIYKIREQEHADSGSTFDVTHFAGALKRVQSDWPQKDDGLVLFSGDIFSPSLDSVITRGSHMVPIIHQLGIDAAVPGNHEFDYGYAQLCKNVLARKDHEKDPWILTNMLDTNENPGPDEARRKFLSEVFPPFKIFDKAGIKVGIIGLVGDWIASVGGWPEFIRYENIVKFAKDFAVLLRREHCCNIVIALTHSRLADDIALADALFVKADSPDQEDVIDLILGGHDHEYYIGRGIEPEYCQGFQPEASRLKKAETSDYPARIIKSGTDFREFSEVTLEFGHRPNATVRRTVIKSVTVKRIEVTPSEPQCPEMKVVYDKIIGLLGQEDRVPLCRTGNSWDLHNVRIKETAFGNWLADETLKVFKGYDAQGVFLASGCLRGEKEIHAPKNITVNDIREILLFPDPIVVIKLEGSKIWQAFEHGLDSLGAGPFPVFSGFTVEWNSKNPKGQRISSLLLGGQPVKNDNTSYKIATQTWLQKGQDGYTMFKGTKPINPDSGVLLISVIFEHFLESSRDRLAKLREETNQLAQRAGDPEWQTPGKYWSGYGMASAVTLPSWEDSGNIGNWDIIGDMFTELGHQIFSAFQEQQPPRPPSPPPDAIASLEAAALVPFPVLSSIFTAYQTMFSSVDSSTDQWASIEDGVKSIGELLGEVLDAIVSEGKEGTVQAGPKTEPAPFELPPIDGRLHDTSGSN